MASCSQKGINLAYLGTHISENRGIPNSSFPISLATDKEELSKNAQLIITARNIEKTAFAHRLSQEIISNKNQNIAFSALCALILPIGFLWFDLSILSIVLIQVLSFFLIHVNGSRLAHFPKYQFKLLFRKFQESFYFPSIWTEIQQQKISESNAPHVKSFQTFKECSEC